jgi:hypothetical protein
LIAPTVLIRIYKQNIFGDSGSQQLPT